MEDSTLNSHLSPYTLLFKALSLIPFTHYLLFILITLSIILYNFLEIHFFHDLLFTFFNGDPVTLTCNFSSQLYQSVGSKCKVLHGRFSSTPWLCSPHLQTGFLSFCGNSPDFVYKRRLFKASDGGTIALDWLSYSDIVDQGVSYKSDDVLQDDKAPIVIVIPGLTSDSASAYIKHLVFAMAKKGWNVVVSNHRGLGGVSMTSDCFYNAGWTEDLRIIIDHVHCLYPEAPLYAVGTSIGSNILVKYLGEDGINVPLVGAASICSTWDLLICDRFINRRLAQKFYNRVLATGLQGFAQLHHSILSRLVDSDILKLSRSVRDFDKHATRVLAKYETVDTYYRRSSCVNVLGNVSVPLICVSALDDPVCTKEAIPWDECRANENIILATTEHGGHLAYFEGITANSIWWVRAVDEYFDVLHSSPLRNRRKKAEASSLPVPHESSIDQAPYVNVTDGGMVTAIGGNTQADEAEEEHEDAIRKDEEPVSEIENSANKTEKTDSRIDLKRPSVQNLNDLFVFVKRNLVQLGRQSRVSIWLLAYIAVVTTWPVMGSSIFLFIKKRFKNINTPSRLLRR
ncbi:uncharacterized protein LOC126660169 [Mercurialis annua]|uniref:uncharacterized protein LOC126660169 n=1 Tax=Mercurialis annua TaxID=3986 RepID=UPI00216082E5|nr:uncharacterized protein LOC126660169 [Mercurialis annua]